MIRSIKRYHPERHYMRGPGPKWIEKHCGGNKQIAPAIDDYRRYRQLLTNFFFQVCKLERLNWLPAIGPKRTYTPELKATTCEPSWRAAS